LVELTLLKGILWQTRCCNLWHESLQCVHCLMWCIASQWLFAAFFKLHCRVVCSGLQPEFKQTRQH
jgi:hypothetical protein